MVSNILRKIIILLIIAAIGAGVYFFYLKDKNTADVYTDLKDGAKKVKSEVRAAVNTKNTDDGKKSPTDWQNLLPENEKQIYEAAKVPKN